VDPLDREKAAAAWTAPLARRVGWQIRLDTPGARRTFSFDCIPFASGTVARFALIGRQLSGPVA
jgi:hypothetical protein